MDEQEIGQTIKIHAEIESGKWMSAMFAPDRGMNLLSYKKDKIEVIDQATRPLFLERYAGLGPLIGPHFHHRNENIIPPIRNEELFPHIAKVRSLGIKEPFSHGIGRYAPWKVELQTEDAISAILNGSDSLHGNKLSDLEGQDFQMRYQAKMKKTGLEILLSVKSDTESVVGLHTYYALPLGKGVITARVQNKYVDKSEFKSIPSTWNFGEDHTLLYNLERETDFGFHPYPDPLHGVIHLQCESYAVHIEYSCENQENSFQVWHHAGGSFVCIEPMSAKDPRKPKLTVSGLKILIRILE
jgi:hypothetical protein